MRTTLQTVPESLPADHVTNSTSTTTSSTPAEATKTHTHTNSAAIKTRTSTTKVSFSVLIAKKKKKKFNQKFVTLFFLFVVVYTKIPCSNNKINKKYIFLRKRLNEEL